MEVKFWGGKCIESLLPGMYLQVYTFDDENPQDTFWADARYIGEDSNGYLVFEIFQMDCNRMPPGYDGYMSNSMLRPITKLTYWEDEPR